MSYTAGPDGLLHLGVLYDSTDEFVAIVMPRLEDALECGQTVVMLVDAGVADRFRDRLGAVADGIVFPNPPSMFREGPHTYLDHLRGWERRDHRTLVVGQYSALDSGERACASAEDGINLTLSDRSITLLCACARSLGSSMEATARRTHPKLITAGITTRSPDYCRPSDRSSITGRVWGPVALRSNFRDTADCHRLRDEIAGIAEGIGLVGDNLKAAVLAVHEAAALACRAGGGPADGDLTDDGDDLLLEVRVSARTMLSEVRQSWTATRSDTHGRPVAPESPTRWLDLLRHVRPFSHHVDVQDTVETRVTRVLTYLDLSPPLPRVSLD